MISAHQWVMPLSAEPIDSAGRADYYARRVICSWPVPLLDHGRS
ncbi:unnamed protein product, partial [marine sediment metagenome]